MLANLMFSGRLDELPDLKIVLAHGGGFIPYQIGRLVHGHSVRSEANAISKSSPKDLLKRIYFDSLVFEPQALRYLIDLVGADHVCIGTDAPFDMADNDPTATIDAVPRDYAAGASVCLLRHGTQVVARRLNKGRKRR